MLLPLDQWRELIGFNPYHFWGAADETLRVTSSCNPVLKKWSWQASDRAGRSEIVEAIERAENDLERVLGHPPAPKYVVERVPAPKLHSIQFQRTSFVQRDGRWGHVRLSLGHVLAMGPESLTLVQANVPVNFISQAGDGYYDLFEVQNVVFPSTDAREVRVYFSQADRLVGASLEDHRIAPVRCSFDGNNLTIRGRAWLLYRPILHEGVNPSIIAPTNLAASYVGTVDVYRSTTNTNGTTPSTAQALAYWETRPTGCGACTYCSTVTHSQDPAATASVLCRVAIRDQELGLVAPVAAVYDAATQQWVADPFFCIEPDYFVIRYRAGYPLQSDGSVDPTMADLITALAAAHLQKPICACEEASRRLAYWQRDLSHVGEQRELYITTQGALDCPFGTRRGHLYAWQRASRLALMSGLVV